MSGDFEGIGTGVRRIKTLSGAKTVLVIVCIIVWEDAVNKTEQNKRGKRKKNNVKRLNLLKLEPGCDACESYVLLQVLTAKDRDNVWSVQRIVQRNSVNSLR
jgi:hypothetical protein